MISSVPLEDGSSHATCTTVVPGANDPCTRTCVPVTAAWGDDPRSSELPSAPVGMSNVKVFTGLTGTVPPFWMLSR